LITIIGSGRVGSTIASQLVAESVDDLLLVDIIDGLPQGEGLDLTHMASHYGSDVEVTGSNDYRDMTGSNLVIVPAGLARKPGMTRLDLLQKNTEIITKISEKIKEYAQKAIVMMITNPLDAMTYVALKTTGFPNNRVFGMGGMLDLARFTSLIAESLGVSYESVQSMVIGQHGEAMLPLPRFSSVGGIPLLDMIGEGEANELVEKTRKVAAQVIEMKGATFYAPAKSVADMVQSIVRDKKTVIPVSAYLNGEYGVRDLCIGVPVVLGNNGVERIIELKLNEQEQTQFMKGATALKSALGQIGLHK